MDYISLRVDAAPCTADITDLIADLLAEAGYESFEPDSSGLNAYIPAHAFDEQAAREALADLPIPAEISLSHSFIEHQDWNEEWEKNYFQPIVIENRCVVHSSFHKDVPKAEFDIVIDPKMAFGTGHHSTTNLILSYLLDMDLKGLKVTDMGTGTGILAILCAMKGAREVSAIEIDPDAYANAVENFKLNGVTVNALLGDASRLPETPEADLFLANINRNIIIGDMEAYRQRMHKGSRVIFSGFYTEDAPLVAEHAATLGMKQLEMRQDNNWAALLLEVE